MCRRVLKGSAIHLLSTTTIFQNLAARKWPKDNVQYNDMCNNLSMSIDQLTRSFVMEYQTSGLWRMGIYAIVSGAKSNCSL